MSYNCAEELLDIHIEQLLKLTELFELSKKYFYFKLRQEILNSSNKKFCPVNNCDSWGTRNRNSSGVLPKFITCGNHHHFCFDCHVLKSQHKNISCEELVDVNFEIWKMGKDIKQCPNCAYWIEKNEGCNHMTCVACAYQWCWLCNNEYTPNHYDDQSLPCYGLMFSIYLLNLDDNILREPIDNDYHDYMRYYRRRRFRRCLEVTGMSILAFFCFLFAGFPFMAVVYQEEKLRHEYFNSYKSKLYLKILVCMAAFILQPFFILLIILIFVLFIAFLPLSIYLLNRWRNSG